ncbi:MAG: Dipeptide-binding transporter, periplasmic substrate-binding component [Modestobacter sp.]|jgi:peptide/nickel transport system substrate-binding protein|nr:Dipeptide-binding transporter, periplasmic substrate-binding component [Modestobacter sp.]
MLDKTAHPAPRDRRQTLVDRSGPRRGRGLRLAALCCVGSLWLAACTSSTGSDSGATTGGQTVEEVVVAVPALTPTLTWDGGGGLSLEAYELNANFHAGLVRNPYVEGDTPGTLMQDFNEYEGYLAESYDVSDDGLTYTFHLRPDLISSAGNPFTADDVLWSIERKWNTPTYARGTFAPALTDLNQMQKIDDHTVAFTLSQPGLGFNFLGLLANMQGSIYDTTVLRENATPEDPYAVEWSKTNSGWGMGAYSVETWTPDQEMVLVANPNYVFGEPAVKRVFLRVVPDAGTRASMVISGDVHIAEGLRPTDQAQLATAEGVVVPEVEDPIEYIDMALVTNKAPFDNELVRQAMALAVPYDEIIEQVYSGRAARKVGIINPATRNYSTADLPTHDYDPERAKELLAEAGFPDGLSFSLTVSNAVPDVVDAAVMIQSYAADAGFEVTIDRQPVASFAQGRFGGTYQSLMYKNRAFVQTPTYAMTVFWEPFTTSAPSRWRNQEFTDTVNAAIAAGDPLGEEAGELWAEAMKINLNSTPEIFVAAVQPSQAFRESVGNYTYRSENAIDFASLEITE